MSALKESLVHMHHSAQASSQLKSIMTTMDALFMLII